MKRPKLTIEQEFNRHYRSTLSTQLSYHLAKVKVLREQIRKHDEVHENGRRKKD